MEVLVINVSSAFAERWWPIYTDQGYDVRPLYGLPWGQFMPNGAPDKNWELRYGGTLYRTRYETTVTILRGPPHYPTLFELLAPNSRSVMILLASGGRIVSQVVDPRLVYALQNSFVFSSCPGSDLFEECTTQHGRYNDDSWLALKAVARYPAIAFETGLGIDPNSGTRKYWITARVGTMGLRLLRNSARDQRQHEAVTERIQVVGGRSVELNQF